MFELERAIADWRRQMAAGGIRASAVLDELENHLREEIRSLASKGTPEAEAFRLATARLGGVDSVRAEFEKLSNTSQKLRGLRLLLWAGVMLVPAIALLSGFFRGKQSVLLMTHSFTLTGGYAAAFLAGSLGIYYVGCRQFNRLTATLQEALSRSAILLVQLSAGLVLAGLLLGVFWSAQNRGQYLSGDAREIGTLCVLGWLTASWLLQRSCRLSADATILLCVGGNIVVSLAWFGAGLFAHGQGIGSCWPLNAALGLNLFSLALGLQARFESAQA